MTKQSKAMAKLSGKKREIIKDKYLCKNCGNKKFWKKPRGLICTRCKQVLKE